jgi:hypothetical protein
VTHCQPNGSLLGCFGKDALYIHDSAAGGYPILVNLDEKQQPKDENMVKSD